MVGIFTMYVLHVPEYHICSTLPFSLPSLPEGDPVPAVVVPYVRLGRHRRRAEAYGLLRLTF